MLKPGEADRCEGKVRHRSDWTDTWVKETCLWDSLVIWLGVPYVVFVPWLPHLRSGGDKHIHLIWLLALIDLKY